MGRHYKTCTSCGSNLDPQESCQCYKETPETESDAAPLQRKRRLAKQCKPIIAKRHRAVKQKERLTVNG